MAHYEFATQTWERGYKALRRQLRGSWSPIFLLAIPPEPPADSNSR